MEGQLTLLLDERFDIVWASSALTDLLGWDDVRGRNATEFVHPEDLELVLATMARTADRSDPLNALIGSVHPEAADVRLLDIAGKWQTFECTTFDHLDDPKINGVLCVCRPIRDRSDLALAIDLLGSGANVEHVLPIVARLADRSLGATTRTAFAWRHGDRTYTVTAADTPALDHHLAAVATLVWSKGMTAPRVFGDLTDADLGSAGYLAQAAGYLTAFIVPIVAPHGDEVIGAMIAWGHSSLEFHVAVQSPIHIALRLAALAIADSRTKRDLRWAAAHDPLTGLANRAEFAHRLDVLATTDDVVLLYIDLDDFKPVNDVNGHAVGDAVLVEVGQRILDVIGEHDVVGRLGGDEFAVVCAHTNDAHHGREIANRIVAGIRQPIHVHGLRLRIGASVGVAVGAHPLIPALLMERADDALFEAKSSGKNTVRLAS